jgi:hypothetical protein
MIFAFFNAKSLVKKGDIMGADTFSRIIVSLVNENKVSVINDYVIGEYIAHRTYFDEMNSIQEDMIDDGLITTATGQELDINSTGGQIGLQIYMESLNSAYQSMLGLAKAGLSNEKQLWKNI